METEEPCVDARARADAFKGDIRGCAGLISPAQVRQVSAGKTDHVFDHQSGVLQHSLPFKRSGLLGLWPISGGSEKVCVWAA